MKDPANGAQIRGGSELGGLGVEHVQLVDPIRRLGHLTGDLVAPRGRQVPLELAIPDLDVTRELGDLGHHVRDGPGVPSGTKRHDVLLVLAAVGVFHSLIVGECGRWADDVGARQQGNVFGVAAEAEVKRARALVVGRVQSRNWEAERRAEVFPVLGHAVGDGVQREEFGSAAQTHVDHLDKGHLGLGKARLGENSLDIDGSGDGIVIVEGARHHTDREEERAEEVLLSFVSPAEGVNAVEANAHRVEACDDSLKDGDPSRRNVGTADSAGLTNDSLLLRAVAHFPSRARFVDTGRAAGVEIRPGIAVLVGEATSIGDDNVGRGRHLVALLRVQELAEGNGGSP